MEQDAQKDSKLLIYIMWCRTQRLYEISFQLIEIEKVSKGQHHHYLEDYQCNQIGRLLDFGQLFKAFGRN